RRSLDPDIASQRAPHGAPGRTLVPRAASGGNEVPYDRGREWNIAGGADMTEIERIPGYCALCASRCGSIAVVENGRFVALEPDPTHPTGQALCSKGRAAPELVYHPDRLRHPLKRTRPKGERDPKWERISWAEALDLAASRLRRGPEPPRPPSAGLAAAPAATPAP